MKTVIKTIVLGIFVLSLCSASCESPPFVEKRWQIKVRNNTNEIINYLDSYHYPDTTIPDRYDKIGGIRAKDYTVFESEIPWHEAFNNAKASKLSFFFFSPDTIEKYGWENVRANYRILARKDFTLQELKDSDWTVAYP